MVNNKIAFKDNKHRWVDEWGIPSMEGWHCHNCGETTFDPLGEKFGCSGKIIKGNKDEIQN